MDRRTLAAAAAAIGVMAGAPALADTLNFNQFLTVGDGNTFADGSGTWSTTGGVGFSISGPQGLGLEVLVQGTSEFAQFAPNVTVLADNPAGASTVAGGPITITFASPISSITNVAAEPVNTGSVPYTATLTAYDGTTVLGTDTFSSTSRFTPSQTVGDLSFGSSGGPADITSITLSTTQDDFGILIGPYLNANGGVPEPGAWALVLVGFAGLGAALRASRRRLAREFA